MTEEMLHHRRCLQLCYGYIAMLAAMATGSFLYIFKIAFCHIICVGVSTLKLSIAYFLVYNAHL